MYFAGTELAKRKFVAHSVAPARREATVDSVAALRSEVDTERRLSRHHYLISRRNLKIGYSAFARSDASSTPPPTKPSLA